MFWLHVTRPRGACIGSVSTRRTIHLPTCRVAGLARHSVRIDLDEAVRLSGPFHGPDGRTHLCQLCQPWTVMRPDYPRDLGCLCPNWRAYYGCPVHGPAIRALDDLSLERLTGPRY